MENNENITIKVDHNNLIYIDPNSVMENGVVQPRNINQEDLSVFINLETELVPRTTLNFDKESKIKSIARGTLNFLKPNSKDGDYSTGWTDTFFSSGDENLEGSTESFGIENIKIDIKSGMIPQITINFLDVRGKTLFESPENSPYKSFFHLPWPVFYLTVKGFYGKAVRYKLHMVKFSSSFDDEGNFRIVTSFVGSTFAFLNDIPMSAVLNSAYMYPTESTITKQENTKTGQKEQKVIKNTRGFDILKSVYSEMKQKKIIPQDFPVKTIQDISTLAKSLDTILEQQIFKDVIDAKIMVGLNDHSNNIYKFYEQVRAWDRTYLDKMNPLIESGKTYFKIIKDKNGSIMGMQEGSIERIININTKTLNNNDLFNKELQKDKQIKFDASLFTTNNVSVLNLTKYVITKEKVDFICMEDLFDDLLQISTTFNQKKIEIEKEIEKKMNEIISSKNGFGFKPTIRNLFAIILANTEVFVRLMKDTHNKAFESSEERKKIVGNFSNDSVGEGIYPWPEITRTISNEGTKIITYPGEESMRQLLKSDDAELWPEVDFVEEFIAVVTNKTDNLTNKENGVNNITYFFEDTIVPTNNISSSLGNQGYYDKTLVSFVYEIYERIRNVLIIDNFDKEIIKELVNVEFENISNNFKNEGSVLSIVNAIFKVSGDGKSVLERYVDLLKAYSQYDRLPYLNDNLPTTDYIKDIHKFPFEIKNVSIDPQQSKPLNVGLYENINKSFLKHKTSEDVTIRYPFVSETYQTYLKGKTNNSSIGKFLSIKDGNTFLSGSTDYKMWFKKENIFDNKVKYGNSETHIFNTHFFHNQLFTEFFKFSSKDKFTGSAYLFLNSIPFIELNDEIEVDGEKIILYKLLNNVSSTHNIPYHLLLKWGSIYYRYKLMLKEGVDLFKDIADNSIIKEIDITNTFDNNTNKTFMGVNISNLNDIGLHPYYDALFHQTVKGYNHFNVEEGENSYNNNTFDGSIISLPTLKENGKTYWTNYVDNEKFDNKNSVLTILPSSGNNSFINRGLDNQIMNENFSDAYHKNFRIIWEDEIINETQVGKQLPTYNEYFNTVDGVFSLEGNNKKVIDLIALFSTEMLESMENMFLRFCDENAVNDTYITTNYNTFQDVLRDVVTINKENITNINDIKEKQKQNLLNISDKIRSHNNLLSVTLKNPKGYKSNILYGFVGLNENKFNFKPYSTDNITEKLKNLELILGEDVDGFYNDFFITYDIDMGYDEIKNFKPIIYLFAGLKKNKGSNPTQQETRDFILNKIILNDEGVENKYNLYMSLLLNKISELKVVNEIKSTKFIEGYENNAYKLDLYNSFKSFNDKWTSGNSIGDRLLIEDFLFLDKANKDIGDRSYLNIEKFIDLCDGRNTHSTLYGALSGLLRGNDMDMRTLPSYTNFYGSRSAGSIIPSTDVANNIFGVFNEVDYEDSSPKTIIQYVGNTSSHLEGMSNAYKFKNDAMDVSSTTNNSLIITSPIEYSKMDISKSNKVVAFEVSFGDQNQSIFTKLGLNQDSFKNTAESFMMSDRIARSETGSGVSSIDINLFEFYNKQSYTCNVTCMGNVMIQPTMYFQLKNVPMFKGSYWITEVSHDISDNKIITNFTGVRMPIASLPTPEDSFMSSYKSLFDKIINKSKITTSKETIANEKTITTKNGTTVVSDNNIIKGEEDTKDNVKVGETIFGVPYNGYNGEKNIQKVFNGKEYLKATVGRIGTSTVIDDNEGILLINFLNSDKLVIDKDGEHGLKWKDLKEINDTHNFYFLNVSRDKKADDVIKYRTEFFNPIKNIKTVINPSWNLDRRNNKKLTFNGLVNYNKNSPYGIMMSNALMKKLNIQEGEIIYFNHL